MEACQAVEREVERVLSKFTGLRRTLEGGVGEQLAALTALQQQLEEGEEGGGMTEQQLAAARATLAAVSGGVARIASEHRDLHCSVSKVGKAIDRNFVNDWDCTSREDVFRGETRAGLLTEVVLQHLYREGRLEISETLSRESGVTQYQCQDIRQPFIELNRILASLQERELGPALAWVQANREALNLRGTSLLFSRAEPGGRQAVRQNNGLELRLHKLKFVELLRAGERLAAVRYARQHFPTFVSGQEREVQSLMGAVMYSGPGLEQSPYSHLLSPANWQETADLFLRDACALLGLSMESPLTVAVTAGCKALPALLNIKQVMQQRQVSAVWNAKDELPIEIELGGDCRYHSVFACPILRQQTADTNPPMKLVCGHVISKDALVKLTQGHKLKCPYCPLEQSPGDARPLYF